MVSRGGTGAQFTITTTGAQFTITTVTCTAAGTGYIPGDIINNSSCRFNRRRGN